MRGLLLESLAQACQSVVRARNYLHAHDRADLGGGCGAGIGCRFHARHVAAEKRGHVARANFFPAGERYIRGLERGVCSFEKRAESLALDHSNCLLSHRIIQLMVRNGYFFTALASPRNTLARS